LATVAALLLPLVSTASAHAQSQPAAPAKAPRKRAPEPPPAPAPAPPPDIRAHSSLSQTAAWVGDAVAFVVEIDMAPGVEIVADDLKPEKLTIEGLELGTSSSSEEIKADGWRTVRYVYPVTPWDIQPPKRIGDLVVKFRRPVTTATADGSAPAMEIKVPGATLSMRSTLPDDGSASGTRDRQASLPAPGWTTWLRPIGLGFIALGAAPVALWILGRARQPRVSKPRPSTRSLQALAKSLLDELQIIDTSTPEGRRRAYDRIDQDVRAYVLQAENVPAPALTADELRAKLSGARRVRADAVCDVLAACEHARYAPIERLPDANALGETISQVRLALGR
jgi:hypothetical protein